MPYIPKKQYEEYLRIMNLKDNGKLLTPDGIRFICEANGYDAEKIGKEILSILPKIINDNMKGEYNGTK